MSASSLAGGIGIGLQTAKNTYGTASAAVAEGSIKWFPATSIDLNIDQAVSLYPYEVGGEYYQRGSYKAAVQGGGGFSALARPNSIGYLLKAVFGKVSSAPSGNSDGCYVHTFSPRQASEAVTAWGGDGLLPWVTLIKNLSGLMGERHSDAKCQGIRISVPTANLATMQSSFAAARPERYTLSGAMTFDTGQAFTTCTGSVTLDGVTTASGGNNAKASNIDLAFGNGLSTDEHSVGNYYLDDITLLSRAASASFSLIVRDATLWNQVYNNGTTPPVSGAAAAWSPVVYQGTLVTTLTTPGTIGTGTQQGTLAITLPKLDYHAFPTGLAGNQLVRATLATAYTIGANGYPSVVLTNTVASYPD